MYFCVQNGPVIDPTASPPVQLYTLYRRVLLVSPGLINNTNFPTLANQSFYEVNDLSVRMQKDSGGNYITVPNSLGDLTKRENRFAHYGPFPFQLNGGNAGQPYPIFTGIAPPGTFPNRSAYLAPFHPSSPRFADDVLLTNVAAFDVQLYNPQMPVQVAANTALTPSDVGYTGGGAAQGCYADLGGPTWLPGFPILLSPRLPVGSTLNLTSDPPTFSGTALTNTYDTWSLHYENNGIDDDGANGIDQSTNGIDDPPGGGNGVVDDPSERETNPPYPAPLRGIKVTIRVYEPSSKQVRQMTVVQDFLPE